MKTIEEAAKEYASCEIEEGCLSGLRGIDASKLEPFKDGIEFAQRWIPVKEELPEYYESVLMNFSGGAETFLVWRAFSPDYEKDIYTISGTNRIINLKPIEWRPLKYK